MFHMIPDLDVRRNVEEDVVTGKEDFFFRQVQAAQAWRMARRVNDL